MDDPALLALMLGFLLAIGAGAGLIAGLLGVGGGIVLVPAFFYAFAALGFEGPALMRLCLGTSLATIVVTSARSLAAHHERGAADWGILRRWSPGIALGAILGVVVVGGLETRALQAIFGALALVVAFLLGVGRDRWQIAPAMPGGLVRAILSPLLGFLSVLMGIGGGSFGVPLMSLYGQPIHRAVGTASGFGLAIAMPSVVGFLLADLPQGAAPPGTVGAVNLIAFAVIVAMTLVTAPLGAALAHRADSGRLKRIFALFLAAVSANMLISAL